MAKSRGGFAGLPSTAACPTKGASFLKNMDATTSLPEPKQEQFWQRYIPLAIWVGAVLLGLVIPLKIMSLGYMPADDALRHVAKVISGKTWPEIMLVRPGFGEDEHPGWHATLGAVHQWFGLGKDHLLLFSMVAPFVLFWLVMLWGRKRPEALLTVLFAASLTASATFIRPLFGRPFVVVMIVYVVLLRLWAARDKLPIWQMLLSVGLMGVSVWVHGSWYLFGFLVAVFALAGQWRKAFQFTGCWLMGVALGACLTGRPVGYIHETTAHLFDVFGGQPLARMLVLELQPGGGDLFFVALIGLALVWRVARGEWKNTVVLHPFFVAAALGWLLGLKVARFWLDWGFPAAVLWLALELEQALESRWSFRSAATGMLACFAAAGVFIGTTRDIGGRWTNDLTIEYVTPETPGIAGWLPDKGGIIYNSDMLVFFRMFYANPHADWKYMLGFEPGIMPREDFEILRKIQWNWSASKAFEPWVKKMRPEDRMILLQGPAPGIKGLEWYYAASDTWIGRLPRKPAAPEMKP